jgi:formylglycine-generating enzyme required for sulfatase activity
MAGNMVEMVADWYADDYYASSPSDNPTGPASGGAQYSGRGGGWKSMAKWLRTAERDWYAPDDEGGSLGFRCAK